MPWSASVTSPTRESFRKVRYLSSGEIIRVLTLVRLVYPWAETAPDAVVCDVGGSNGHIMFHLVRAHPHLQIVVQDLEIIGPMFDEVRLHS